MEKRKALHEEKINAKSYLLEVFQNGCRDGHCVKSWDVCGCLGTCGLAFDRGDVWSVDEDSATSIVYRDGAVYDHVVFEYVLKVLKGRTAQFDI